MIVCQLPPPDTHAVQWRPTGYILSDVPCRPMPMACQDCHVMPTPPPPNVSGKLTGGCLRHSANGLMKCAPRQQTQRREHPQRNRNPLKRDRTRLSLVPECTGLNQVEAEAGNPASKRARERIRQGDAKRREAKLGKVPTPCICFGC